MERASKRTTTHAPDTTEGEEDTARVFFSDAVCNKIPDALKKRDGVLQQVVKFLLISYDMIKTEAKTRDLTSLEYLKTLEGGKFIEETSNDIIQMFAETPYSGPNTRVFFIKAIYDNVSENLKNQKNLNETIGYGDMAYITAEERAKKLGMTTREYLNTELGMKFIRSVARFMNRIFQNALDAATGKEPSSSIPITPAPKPAQLAYSSDKWVDPQPPQPSFENRKGQPKIKFEHSKQYNVVSNPEMYFKRRIFENIPDGIKSDYWDVWEFTMAVADARYGALAKEAAKRKLTVIGLLKSNDGPRWINNAAAYIREYIWDYWTNWDKTELPLKSSDPNVQEEEEEEDPGIQEEENPGMQEDEPASGTVRESEEDQPGMQEEEYAPEPPKGGSRASASGKKRKTSGGDRPATKKPRIVKIDPDTNLLWLPTDGSQDGGTYSLSKTLAPRKILSSENTVFKCKSVCGNRCWYINPKTHEHCKRKPCVDYRYCTQHLMSEKHLLVGKYSRYLRSLDRSDDGKGLYAIADAATLKRHGMTDDIPNIHEKTIVFRQGSIIDHYGGEYMTQEKIDERYKDAIPGTLYTVSKQGNDYGMDAFCASTAGSYANDPYNHKNQEAFKQAAHAANINVLRSESDRNFPIVATKDISHGEELLYFHGIRYWTNE